MKILQVVFGLYSGGAERFVVDLSNELAKKHNNEVTILAVKSDVKSTFYKEELSENIIYNSLNYNKLNLSVFGAIYKYIRKYKPDVVHFHLTARHSILPVIFYKKCKYIETIHNQAELIHKNLGVLSSPLDSILYKKTSLKTVAISDANYKSFYNHYGCNCNTLIYNGRTEPIKTPKFQKVSNFINSLKPTKDSVVLCHIARCCKQKNQSLLFNSFQKIIDKGTDAMLIVLGDGFDEYKSHGYKNVFFLGAQHNIADYLYNSDAFCLSSLWEGMPITLIEALACSCIPLGTPVSGYIDLIENKVNGFVSEDFSEDSYIAMLENFMEYRSRINLNQLREVYINKLSIEKCANSYYQIYKQ